MHGAHQVYFYSVSRLREERSKRDSVIGGIFIKSVDATHLKIDCASSKKGATDRREDGSALSITSALRTSSIDVDITSVYQTGMLCPAQISFYPRALQLVIDVSFSLGFLALLCLFAR